MGPSQSGKTYWIYQVIQNIEQMINPAPQKIVFPYRTEYQKFHNKIKKEAEKKITGNIIYSIEFVQCTCKIPAIQDIVCSTNDNVLLILDDLMLITTDFKEILQRLNDYAMMDYHHWKISLMYGN